MTDNLTTELREKLTERGVEYTTNDGKHVKETCWPYMGELMAAFAEYDNGTTRFACDTWCFTPEQAIAATLGRPKVKKVRGMTYDEHGGEVYFLACSGCGDWVDGDLDCIGEDDGPNFCHNCGGEFDGPLLCRACGELADMEFGDMCAECYWAEGEGNDER